MISPTETSTGKLTSVRPVKAMVMPLLTEVSRGSEKTDGSKKRGTTSRAPTMDVHLRAMS